MAKETSAPARSSFVLTAGVVLACFLVFAAIVAFAYLRNRDTSVAVDLSKVDEADQWKYTEAGRVAKLDKLRTTEISLNSYGWVDQSAGVVRLPIGRAMELVVAEQGRKN